MEKLYNIYETISSKKNNPITLEITKNTEKAPYMGSMFNQDVEPSGTYVTQGYVEDDKYINGKAFLNNPLFINTTTGDINYKKMLAKKYNATGKSLTNKLMKLGYDAIITILEDYNNEYGEIVLFPNAKFMMT